MNTQKHKNEEDKDAFFSSDLFKLYSETILRVLEYLSGFIIGAHTINTMWYADNIILMEDSVIKLKELIDTVVDESKMKGANY